MAIAVFFFPPRRLYLPVVRKKKGDPGFTARSLERSPFRNHWFLDGESFIIYDLWTIQPSSEPRAELET